ncbi:Imidazole glycerol phosphate synthase subunit HisH 1 [Pseudobythopirellula maris]|uniref:Imidazole glycerol phosphate synthase subunit HisH n=1 Tax=Pseudobythopirellula maris TaxID=2527991 RepID=A0A5C5ZK89_9BACT|nr:imidazole glycerol phosphate synthase subunit HisH [Pseudobythopirellula maris]TWT86833.1 Imidazole glycerol phosphate synthase subunit HisH 1 [Pseudobythopirellula maris]
MIVIINYDMANLRSVQKAFERVGQEAQITSDPDEVARASRVVLPGVGASADALAALRSRGLEEPIKAFVASGRPFLGICLGLQMLFDTSYEDGVHQGLGLLPGGVVRFGSQGESPWPQELKIPHMGWNQLRFPPAADGRPCPLFTGVDEGAHFYFVHSYYVAPADDSVVAAEADYGGPFCAAVWRDNLFATQFHPEKSQANGLRVLRNFAELPVVQGAAGV